MSRSTSALAEPQPLPWLYPYREDPQSTRLDEPVFRPFVYVSLVCGEQNTTLLEGLVDTGGSDGFAWPHRDGLKWPHFAMVGVLVG